MRRIAALAILALLAACGPTRQERQAELNRLVGQPESAVVSQLGLPSRVYETGGIRFIAYEERRVGYAPGYVGYGPWGYGPGGLGGWYSAGYIGFPPTVERVCETTFEVSGGIVRQVALRGLGCGV